MQFNKNILFPFGKERFLLPIKCTCQNNNTRYSQRQRPNPLLRESLHLFSTAFLYLVHPIHLSDYNYKAIHATPGSLNINNIQTHIHGIRSCKMKHVYRHATIPRRPPRANRERSPVDTTPCATIYLCQVLVEVAKTKSKVVKTRRPPRTVFSLPLLTHLYLLMPGAKLPNEVSLNVVLLDYVRYMVQVYCHVD